MSAGVSLKSLRLVMLMLVLSLPFSMVSGCACDSDSGEDPPVESGGGDDDDDDDSDDDDDDDKPKEVKVDKLYAKYCEGCHGESGDKTPDFTSSKYKSSSKKIKKAIRKGKGSMPGFDEKLEKKEVDALVKYVQAFKKSKKSSKDKEGGGGKEKVSGKKVYAKYCESCHGKKGDKTPDFTAKDYDASKKAVEKAIREGKGSMPGFDSKLSDAEVKALVKYVRKFND